MSLNDTNIVNGKNGRTTNSIASLRVSFGGYSVAGKKDENQDAFAALIPSNSEVIVKGVVAAIADGVSSASKAKEAAQLSVTQFIADYYATPETWSTKKSAAKVLTGLNQWLYSQSESQLSSHSRSIVSDSPQWLTTFTSLIIKSTTAYIFHVGDSRLSLYRDEKVEAITRDHNRKQGNTHVVLSRALGADPRLKVDVHTIKIQGDDIYLLTCDGVHDYLSHREIEECFQQLPKQPNNQVLEQASQQLVALALENGSDDNVSCLLVSINSTPHRKLIEIERDLLTKVIPPALDVGAKLDGYKVNKIIHASIRSHLYLVEHEHDNKPLVIKVPSTNFADDPFYLQGFKREAWLGERISHRNIMSISGAKTDSQFLYHICEFIDGQTLSAWMHDNPKPALSQVRDIIEQLILALRAFQRLDVVHRDLKPDNIMIDAYGKVTLIDYGTVLIASLAENDDVIKETVPQGSLNYIAPETLLNMHADYQSDLFSLGVIAYEMLTGALPYKPMKRAEVNFSAYHQWHYLSAKQFRADLPIWADMALEKATQADPSRRYQAYSEFFADINKPNTTAIEEYKNKPLIQRKPVQFWQSISAILFVLLIIAVVN